MNKGVLYVLAALVVVVLAIGGYFYMAEREPAATAATTADPATGAVEAGTTPATGKDSSVALKEVPVVAADETFIGKADAPVTIVEYFSLGCPHCATFHESLLPQLKKDYIDTGKVRLVLRDFPLDGPSLGAAMMTRCMKSNDAYFGLVDVLFGAQAKWHAQNAGPELANIAKGAGMDQAALDACLKDEALRTRIVGGVQEAQAKFEINSTPTFLINDRKLGGVGSYEDFKATVEAALAKK